MREPMRVWSFCLLCSGGPGRPVQSSPRGRGGPVLRDPMYVPVFVCVCVRRGKTSARGGRVFFFFVWVRRNQRTEDREEGFVVVLSFSRPVGDPVCGIRPFQFCRLGFRYEQGEGRRGEERTGEARGGALVRGAGGSSDVSPKVPFEQSAGFAPLPALWTSAVRKYREECRQVVGVGSPCCLRARARSACLVSFAPRRLFFPRWVRKHCCSTGIYYPVFFFLSLFLAYHSSHDTSTAGARVGCSRGVVLAGHFLFLWRSEESQTCAAICLYGGFTGLLHVCFR